MRENRSRCWLIAGAIFVVAAVPAFASGFSIYEQDAKASAMAGAWTARAGNAAANWYNPAAMVRQESSFQVGINMITLGRDTSLTVPTGVEFDPESSIAMPAHLYYVQKTSERIAWGFGINTPYGLSTEWDTPPITLSARQAKLVSFVFNPNASFALDDHISFGIGLDYIYTDIQHFSRDVGVTGPTQDLSGDGTDWGFNLALHYDSENYKAGISYRSRLSPEIKGDLTLDGVKLSGGKTDLDLPDQLAVGFGYTRPEKWELELDISWARWSNFQELAITYDSIPPQPPIVENWDDTYAIRLGGSYDLGERHEIRYGVSRDRNPIPDETLRPSIPDADRWAGTVGYGYSGSKIDIDFYYMALFFDDRTVAPSAANQPGVIPGEYKSFSHLLGITFGWRFGGGS